MLSVLVMMVIDTIIFTFLGWYLDQVLPKEFGVRQPYGFLFRKSYWYPEATDGWFGRPKEAAARGSLLDGSFSADSEQQGFEHVEEVSAELLHIHDAQDAEEGTPDAPGLLAAVAFRRR